MSKYALRVNVEINQTDPYGSYMYGNGFKVSEDISFEADSFLKIASVLGLFHKLGEDIKEAEKEDY